MTIGGVELGVFISVTTALIAVAGFYLSQRKERDSNVRHQAHVDETMLQIQELVKEMRADIKEIKDDVSDHSGKIARLDGDLERLHSNVERLAEEFRVFKHEATTKINAGRKTNG